MKIFEKGTGEEVIVILHPMMASHKSCVEITRYLGNEKKYIIPDLSGHGADIENEFLSLKDEADRLEDYLKNEKIEKIDMIIGLSMGCLVAIELFSRMPDKVGRVILEGAPLYRYGFLFKAIAGKLYLNMQKKAVTDRELMEKEFANNFGESVATEMVADFVKMKPETIRNCANATSRFYFPKIDKQYQKKMFFRYGDKDANYKAGVKRSWKYYPDAELKTESGYGHCEFAIKKPMAFAADIS